MESLRLAEKNKLQQYIKDSKRAIERENDTIDRFQKMEYNNVDQITKRQVGVNKLKDSVKEAEKRLKQLLKGELDQVLQEEANNAKNEIKLKNDESLRKKAELLADKKEKAAKSLAYYKEGNKVAREARYANKTMDQSYKHFCKACDSLPEYMLQKLANMPNNKGYVWKSVYCYGDKKAERGQPVTMFERKNKDILHIHEWTDDEYFLYQKEGKNRKTLLHKELINKIEVGNTVSIEAYIK